ncbi:MAG: aryl-sulfate sulfotransferase [Planctomycetes bacterium]|nr:aryl-sulfate sulfotransferase [Planctomycetota bacterium]
MAENEFRIDRCMPRPPEKLGLIRCDHDRAQPGLTLCWSRGSRSARLIGLGGGEVHRWRVDIGPTWHDVSLLGNGNLLVVANEKSYSPKQISRHRVLELDRESNVVWQSFARGHHDARRLPNGHTLLAASAGAHYPAIHDQPMIYDYLQELDQEGDVVWNWHFAPHQPQLRLPPDMKMPAQLGDWPHINTVQSLPKTPSGESDDRFRAGNILVSPRHLHRIFIVDRETDDIVWQWGEAELLGQHQPTMLASGNILLFDNGWGPPMRGWSRVLEMEPLTGEIAWEYHAEPRTDFWSPVGSGAQRFENGNTLICAMNWSEPGRIFEVTPEGDIVWEYWNPEGKSFYRAARYPETALR